MRPTLQVLAPTIDDPIELLLACHDKVRHFADLCLRLRDHVAQAGPDTQAQQAAQAILRYFQIAAPLHHDDEERGLFPALRDLNLVQVNAAVDSLQAEHGDLGDLWRQVQPWLQGTVAGQSADMPREALASFAQRYTAHAQREEDEVYPYAGRLQREQLQRIAAAMVARRTRPA